MPGVKGRSGGARPGAGRKRKMPAKAPDAVGAATEQPHSGALKRQKHEPAASTFDDPLAFLKSVWKGELDATQAQVKAATAALPFMHKKLGEGGKKEQKQDAANKVASRFAAAAPPKLVVAGGKRI